MTRVVIIGAGWAGLSAAIHLSSTGKEIVLLERAPNIGGRARQIKYGDYCLDNGQHLFIGAYQCLLDVMAKIRLKPASVFSKRLFSWQIYTKDSQKLHIYLKNNRKHHTIFAIMRAQGFSFNEKVNFYKLLVTCFYHALNNSQDMTVSNFLNEKGASTKSIKYFFEPLCLASLSTNAEVASSKVFAKVLMLTFSTKAKNTNYLFNKVDLSNTFPIHASKYLEYKNVSIKTNTAVKAIVRKDANTIAVHCNNTILTSNEVIIATNIKDAVKLLQPIPELNEIAQALDSLLPVPITTIYLIADAPFNLASPITGIVDGISHWIFDRSFCNQPNVLSVVITGDNWLGEEQRFLELIIAEVKAICPKMPKIIDHKIIKEKYAAFLCDCNSNKLRPKAALPCKGIYLAGDYINTGLPASIESAMLSGREVAKAITEQKRLASLCHA